MANTFALILVTVTAVTGLVWLLDHWVLVRFRAAKARRAQAAAQAPLTAEAIEKLMTEPVWVEQCKGIFPVIAAVLVLRSFLYEPFQIPSGSMMPTLLEGDFILVNKYVYGLKEPVTNRTLIETSHPQRGDVVVFKYPENPRVDYIKRIIGLPGDRVVFRNKELYLQPACHDSKVCPQLKKIDAEFIESGTFSQLNMPLERYSEKLATTLRHEILLNNYIPDRVGQYYQQPGQSVGEWVVPEGHYFAMGDNRDNSLDSRFWGFVPERNLVGKAVAIWMSFEFDHPEGSSVPKWIPTGVRFNRIGSIQ
ncbi:signal peptidase I [Tolumonas osonensis]|uniref:Signal peptidase I n=1 Tax=Tolumonas osonensis TaxID=675874 RepID=A0A841GBB4_9GAMM|nr:signal peptidase I [Tolumonas osonensis]MBB6056398.1 signal peptidase I [Tolumonas osonensis]